MRKKWENIILCGLPKSGKTTIGKILAGRLKAQWIDTDKEIERVVGDGRSCREIYLEEGRKTFRSIETQVIKGIIPNAEAVISTGGGIFECEENIPILKKMGKILFLFPSIQTVWDRFCSAPFPPYISKEDPRGDFMQLVQTRVPLYQASADYIIEGEDIEEVVKTIESLVLYGG